VWAAWINVAAQLVSDMQVLLGTKRALCLVIDERMIDRTRWVDGVAQQMTDPSQQ
jgi:hypothetical protein